MKIIAEILSIVILLAGMASCAKTDRIYDDTKTEIAMKPVMHTPTKAIVEGTTYPTGVNFGVLAYYSSAYGDQDKWTDLTGENAPVPYIVNQQFVTQGDGTFGGSDPCYWPHQGSLVFAGYSPYGSGIPSFDCSTKTLTITGFVSNGQTDLMYFLPELSDGSLKGLNTSTTPVPASFNHALSLVSFDMQVREGDKDDIKLKKIILKDMYATGNFTVLASDPATAAWTRTSDARDTTVFNSDAGQVLSPSVPVDVLVIPGEAVVMQIVYETKFYDMTQTAVVTKDLTAEIVPSKVGVTTWETGKKYIYDVVIEANKIEVIPSTDYIGVIEKESQK